ncbi:MAG TPA: phosphoribosylanthranilate isomerase [Xanthomonadales bacterium]|nr:phosphoribosylanthranilate isomerase [Xanthomonadales bacterium]
MSARTRVKFCGITRAEDARSAIALGVDAIGLVFVPGSKRCVDLAQAREVMSAVSPLVSVIGLFMDAATADVAAVLDALPLDALQFHGRESAEFCRQFKRPYVKALAMGDGVDVAHAASGYAGARGVLLDAHRSGEQGGSGLSFDWSLIPPALAERIILAGGLTPENVAAAITQVRPYAVDVSSGIESAPGIKCPRRMQLFMNEVDRASAEQGRG